MSSDEGLGATKEEIIESLREELKDTNTLAERLSDLLHKTANALHGGPRKNGLWSFHDLPEIAAGLKTTVDRLESSHRRKGR